MRFPERGPFFYQGAVEQTGSASVSTAQCAFLWFAIVAATVFTVSSLLAAFQTASLFFFSWRLTFMLPAEADTQRACALSRFTDVKAGEQLYVLMVFFFV